MDNAVALVQADLRLNGYLTVSEHPVIGRDVSGYRMMTDLDILAIRFPRMQDGVIGRRHEDSAAPDPVLQVCRDRPDMLIGEVKEGRAVLNASATSAAVIRAALLRFGCCASNDLELAARQFLRRGTADLTVGHRVRLVAFGSAAPDGGGSTHLVITLGQVLDYVTRYVRRQWEVVRHAESKDPAGHADAP